MPRKPPTYEICPYSLRRFDQIEADPKSLKPPTNDEHIFPDVIGGTLAYKLRVDTWANSTLGKLIDGPLAKSFLINGLRLQHGIKSRSGYPTLTLEGTIPTGGKAVEITFGSADGVSTHVKKPVEADPSGSKFKVVVPAAKRDEFVAKFTKDNARKGKTVVIAKEESLINEPLSVDLSIDLLAIKRGLAKIAYCAIYEYLGDAYLNDPLVSQWSKMLLSEDPEEVEKCKIHGTALNVDCLFPYILPPLKPYQHAVAVARLQQNPFVAVSLFGENFHTLLASASETSTYGMEELEGKIVICDAKAATIEFLDFRKHFLEASMKKPMP